MSIATIPAIMTRINAATIDSPIAVFKSNKSREKLESLFAGTVQTEYRIKKDHKNLVGVFDNSMAPSQVLDTLYRDLDSLYVR